MHLFPVLPVKQVGQLPARSLALLGVMTRLRVATTLALRLNLPRPNSSRHLVRLRMGGNRAVDKEGKGDKAVAARVAFVRVGPADLVVIVRSRAAKKSATKTVNSIANWQPSAAGEKTVARERRFPCRIGGSDPKISKRSWRPRSAAYRWKTL
jgi:hypothetical protein